MNDAPWRIVLTQKTSNPRTHEKNVAVADALRMDARETTHATIAAYVRGEDGREPHDQGMRIDPLHLALLRHHGIMPLRMLRADSLGLGFGCDVTHGDRWTDRTMIDDKMAPDVSGKVCIASGMRYDANRTAEPRIEWDPTAHGDLPETIRQAMPGRIVCEIIAHPAFAGTDARVVRIEPTGTGMIGIVLTRGRAVAVTT